MRRGLFIAGTDTEVGKTLVACAITRGLVRRGLSVAALKPVAAGCEATPEGLRNGDALALMGAANVALPYDVVNPYAFAPPIAPHIAAAEAGTVIAEARIRDCVAEAQRRSDWVVVEGVGGWLVPIDGRSTMADVAKALGYPVVLVVGLRLGCLNHALLSAESIAAHGLTMAGWVANHIDPAMARSAQNVQSLAARLPAPCLAEVPVLADPTPTRVAPHLDLQGLGG
jgi:dethiobiotin synthetase